MKVKMWKCKCGRYLTTPSALAKHIEIHRELPEIEEFEVELNEYLSHLSTRILRYLYLYGDYPKEEKEKIKAELEKRGYVFGE